MKITEKCNVLVASAIVAALISGTALPALPPPLVGEALAVPAK